MAGRRDPKTHMHIWITSYQSAAQGAQAYDIQPVRLHDTSARLNSPFDDAVSDLAPIDHRVASPRELWEDWEARECLKAEHADKEYMAELHRLHPEHTEKEHRQFEPYKLGKTDRAGSSSVPVIDLCSSDGFGSEGSGKDEDVNSELHWEKIMAKED